MKEYFKEDNGFSFVEKGEGPVLLLLHGLFGALSNFKDLLNFFSKNYSVVIPKLPLYTNAIHNTGVKSLAKYIAEFIDYKQYKRVIIIGNSLGGHAGLIYTIKNPEKVKAICLTGSSGLYENSFGGTFPRREDYNYIKERVAITFYDPKHATKELVDEVFQIVNDKSRLIRILALAKSAMRNNLKDSLNHIKQPACLIWGKNDTITPPDVAEEFNRLITNSELYWIDKCGHAPMMEHPEKFNRTLLSWLEKIGK